MTTPELMTNFHQRFKEKYPEISYDEMKIILTAPFEMFKRTMASGEFEDIRLQYLFVARVSPARVMKYLKNTYANREKIGEKSFNKYSGLLLNYIRTNPNRFEKYQQQIEKIIS